MQDHLVLSGGARSKEWAVVPLRIGLLGGFRVDRADVALADSAWKRRTAKALTKLLATHPGHALHRDQILEVLWRDVGVESALNSFGKALHAARDALEPELRPRGSSAYLRFRDDVLTLDTAHVLIDADHFQKLAESALRLETVSAYDTALAAYSGDLLPEDRYQDWSAQRRDFLAELHVQLMLGLAEALERRGAHSQAAAYLRVVLQQDPTREDVHRRLMSLYVDMGFRQEAVRQFHICRDALRRKLRMTPDRETVALYQDILANRTQRKPPDGGHGREARSRSVVSR